MVYIRAANVQDDATIKTMVRDHRLDPTSLKWRCFLVAEVDGQIVGIGQVRKHFDCEELGSLIVLKAYRGQGVAAQLVEQLEARAGRPLYLDCANRMVPFYQGFGYQTISYWQAPLAMRLKLFIPFVLRVFGIRVSVMRKD